MKQNYINNGIGDVSFNFIGTKIRIFSLGGGTTNNYANKVNIKIDDNINDFFSCQYGRVGGNNFGCYFVYDKQNLQNKIHHCLILNHSDANTIFSFDGIDINEDDWLLYLHKCLIKDDDLYKYTSDSNTLNTIANQDTLINNFNNYGMNDLSLINNNICLKK